MPGILRSVEASDWGSTLVSTGAIVLIAYVINFYIGYSKSKWNVIDIGKSGDPMQKLITSGLQQFPDKFFRLPTNHHATVIMPKKYLEEIKNWPESELSFVGDVKRRFLGEYTGLGLESHPMIAAVRSNLTQNIGRTLEALQDEIDYATPLTLGPCDEWTEIKIQEPLARIVAIISGRVFVGLPLCRNEEWINISVLYTIDTMRAAYKYWTYGSLTRPLVVPFLQETKQVQKHRANAQKLMRPVIAERLRLLEDPNYDKPGDLIQWVIDQSGDRKHDLWLQAHAQLSLSFAAIHTTTTNMTFILSELASRPEIVEPLRHEVQQLLADDDGRFIKSSMVKLRKMDSFIKETQRMNPLSLVSMNRYVERDVHLSDGTVIPRGSYVAFAADSFNKNPEYWEEPEKFDAFRFEKLRSQPGSENKYQFVKTGPENLNFGHGMHACPGRFFASNEIKMLLSYILLNYDVKFRDNETRPANILSDVTNIPDPSTTLCLKRRKDVPSW